MTGARRGAGEVERVREELRAPRAAGVAGIVFAVLFAVSLVAARAPMTRPADALIRWYTGTDRTAIVVIGLYGIPLAGIAFLWFIGVVRTRIGQREDRLFATVFLGSGLLFVAMLFAAAATASAMALRMEAGGPPVALDAPTMQFMQALTHAFLYVYAARAAGVFMIVTSTIALRTRTVPLWVAVLGYVVAALLLLSLRYFEVIIMLFPLWVALLSVFILVTSGSDSADEDRPGVVVVEEAV